MMEPYHQLLLFIFLLDKLHRGARHSLGVVVGRGEYHICVRAVPAINPNVIRARFQNRSIA